MISYDFCKLFYFEILNFVLEMYRRVEVTVIICSGSVRIGSYSYDWDD